MLALTDALLIGLSTSAVTLIVVSFLWWRYTHKAENSRPQHEDHCPTCGTQYTSVETGRSAFTGRL